MSRQTTIIHFMRHGEVENPRAIRYGRLPGFHLSQAGRLEVETASQHLLGRKITHIYTSPLERTQQSATILGMMLPYVTISLDARLLETKTPAKYEGKGREAGFYYPLHATADAETPQDISNRMTHFVEEKVIEHHGQEIVALSHGDPLAILFSESIYHDSDTLHGIYPPYASIRSYVYSGLELKEVWSYNLHDWEPPTETISMRTVPTTPPKKS